MTLEFLQNYWWMLISILGGLLVFLLFVQGGQSLILFAPDKNWSQAIVDSVSRKWELTFTTLVLFGGAAFASFPLFYSTSFGGAYWLWILILFSFVLQAVSYEYRRKKGNLYGTRTYDVFLFINAFAGCILLGVAVGMFFFGGEFTVTRSNLLDGASPVISRWDNPAHGLEVIADGRCLLLGVAVFFLARMLGCLYLFNSVKCTEKFSKWLTRQLRISTIIFLPCFLGFIAILFTTSGYTVTSADATGTQVLITPYKYWHNFISSPATIVLFLLGVACVMTGTLRTLLSSDKKYGIWLAGAGTVFTVVALFWLAGYSDTPFIPSVSDPQSSLSIRNASSSQFTLTAMSYVSILIPFVIAYIWYVWRKIDKHKIPEKD